jgi:hypothetical protein
MLCVGRQRFQRRDADQGHSECLAQSPGRGDSDPKAGESSGTDADRDPLELFEGSAGTLEQFRDQRQQARRVPRALPDGWIVASFERWF